MSFFASERSTGIWNGTPTGGERRDERGGGNGREGARLMAAKAKVEEAADERGPSALCVELWETRQQRKVNPGR